MPLNAWKYEILSFLALAENMFIHKYLGNQEGVMDSLMEALKTGSAFSRDQKRKRAAR